MVNKIILVGRLGQNPALEYTQGGTAVCKFSVATSERWKDKDGTKQEKTTWHNIQCWSKLAEICEKHLTKGRQVFIEGKQEHTTYEKDGQTKYYSFVTAQNVQFVGDRPQQQDQGPPSQEPSFGNNPDVGFGD